MMIIDCAPFLGFLLLIKRYYGAGDAYGGGSGGSAGGGVDHNIDDTLQTRT